MDKRQKQVFRLVTLLPAFPAVASGTRGEQVLRLTAAGPWHMKEAGMRALRRRVRSRISRDSR